VELQKSSENISRTPLSYIDTAISSLGRILAYIAVAILIVMMLFTVADVLLRYLFNKPILGATEVTEFIMVTLSFFGIVACTVQKSHISVDFITKYIPLKPLAISDCIYYLFSLVLFAFICWQNFLRAMLMSQVGEKSAILGIAIHPFYLIVAISCGVVALWLVVAICHGIINIIRMKK
jgi:TRAP-type transport system small permease protein